MNKTRYIKDLNTIIRKIINYDIFKDSETNEIFWIYLAYQNKEFDTKENSIKLNQARRKLFEYLNSKEYEQHILSEDYLIMLMLYTEYLSIDKVRYSYRDLCKSARKIFNETYTLSKEQKEFIIKLFVETAYYSDCIIVDRLDLETCDSLDTINLEILETERVNLIEWLMHNYKTKRSNYMNVKFELKELEVSYDLMQKYFEVLLQDAILLESENTMNG